MSAAKTQMIGDYMTSTDMKLGSGTFATVYKAVHAETKKEVAIKIIKTERIRDPKLKENMAREIEIMRKLDHPNIVRLHDLLENSKSIYIVMEYCGGGDLASYLKRKGALSEELALVLLRQFAAGLEYLQAHELIHRDLKPQNLLLTADPEEGGVIKIADFGFARNLVENDLAQSVCGSPLYMAPEVLSYRPYDSKVDVWSVGAIAYQMVVGHVPFTARNQVELLHTINRKKARIPDNCPISDGLRALILGMLKRDPRERITFAEFFADPTLRFHEFDRPKVEIDDDLRSTFSGYAGEMGGPAMPVMIGTGGLAPPAPLRTTPVPPLKQQPRGTDEIVISSADKDSGNIIISTEDAGGSVSGGGGGGGSVSGDSVRDGPWSGRLGSYPSPEPAQQVPSDTRGGRVESSPANRGADVSPAFSTSPTMRSPTNQPMHESGGGGGGGGVVVRADDGVSGLGVRGANTGRTRTDSHTSRDGKYYSDGPAAPAGTPPQSTPPQTHLTLPPADPSAGLATSHSSGGDSFVVLDKEHISVNEFADTLVGEGSGARLAVIRELFAVTPGPTVPAGHRYATYTGVRAANKEEEQLLVVLDDLGRQAVAIVAVAQDHLRCHDNAAAVALCVHALSIIHSALNAAQNHSLRPFSDNVSLAVQALRLQYNNTVAVAEHARSLAKDTDVPPPVGKLMYDHATRLGRKAGVEELTGEYDNADIKYQRALLLLMAVVSLIGSSPAAVNDRNIIDNYMEGIRARRSLLRSKKSAKSM